MKLSECENKIKEIDTFLFEAYKKVDIYKYLTPINLNEENERFLNNFEQGIEYNPIYKYEINSNKEEKNVILNKISQYKNELNQFAQNINEVFKILIKREIQMLEELEDMINLANNIGINDNNIDSYSKKIYGEPSNELINKAKHILENDSISIGTMDYNANDCKRLFENILEKLDLNWNIKINEIQSSKISVTPEEKLISINGKRKFSENDLKRLAVHEIGTHVLRAENGSKQPYKMFSMPTGKILPIEEGLATVNEEQYNLLDKKTFRIYAGRVFAVNECMNKSFFEVFKMMLKYFDKEDALYIISRIKRGIVDTKQPNAFVKDYVYLDGYYKVKKYLKNHDKKLLYAGVVGIDEIDEIDILIQNNILKEGKYEEWNC